MKAPNGTRARYAQGCRCRECRQANADYERARRHLNPRVDILVDATETRSHLRWLRRKGVGLKAIRSASGVGESTAQRIRAGKTRQVRQSTADALLLVFPVDALPSALVSAKDTHHRIADLVAHGWTHTQIAGALGSTAKRPALRYHQRDRVTASTAQRVKRLHETALLPALVDRQNAAARQANRRKRLQHD